MHSTPWWSRPMSRRDGLRLGVGGLAGGSFLELCRLVQSAGASENSAHSVPRKTPSNCILIWMDGGPSHFETFDPKPEAPIRNSR